MQTAVGEMSLKIYKIRKPCNLVEKGLANGYATRLADKSENGNTKVFLKRSKEKLPD